MKTRINTEMPKRRNIQAIGMIQNCRSVVMSKRGQPRGGSHNEFAEYLDDYNESLEVLFELDSTDK